MFELAGQVHEYPQFFASLRMTFDPHYHAVQFVRCIARLVHCYPNMADHDVTQFVSELQEEIKTLLDVSCYGCCFCCCFCCCYCCCFALVQYQKDPLDSHYQQYRCPNVSWVVYDLWPIILRSRSSLLCCACSVFFCCC